MGKIHKNILLVEDEAIIAKDQAIQLKKKGYNVIHTYTGEEAIKIVKSAHPPFDLILMDINLGKGLDGTETAQIILMDHDIPVVFLSSHSEPEVVAKTEKITSYGYVTKDSGITVLDASIKMAFKLHEAHQTIKRANESLTLAQSAGRAGTWDWDIVKNIFNWSTEFLNLFGFPQDIIPGLESWLKAVHPEDRENASRKIQESIENKSDLINDYRIILPSGEIRWIRAVGKTYYLKNRPIRMLGLCMDLTELKNAENQILTTLESIQDGFFACDKDWQFIYLNTAAERILGIPRDEILGNNFWEIFPLTLGTRLEKEYLKAAGGKTTNFENFYKPWGRWFYNSCFPREGGGISVYFQDITDRKNAEKRMLQQNMVLQGINKIFESALGAGTKQELGKICLEEAKQITNSRFGLIAEIGDGRDLTFIAVSGSTEGIKNGEEKEVMEACGFKEITDIIIKEGKGFFTNDLAAGDRTRSSPGLKSILSVPLILDNKITGLISVCNCRAEYTADELKSLEAVAPAVVEAFQRKQLEDDLRISEEKTRNLIRYAPSGIYEIDFHSPHFVSVNDVMCEYLGCTREELLAINVYDILDEEGKHTFRKRIAQAIAGEKVDKEVEYKVKAKDGREYYAVLNVTLTYKDGKPGGAFVIAHDVTERKRAEHVLQQSEERYRKLVQNTTAVILRIDPQGIIRFANERALEFFGYNENELIGQPAIGTIVPEKESTGRDLSDMVDKILNNPDKFHSNVNENICKSGKRVWLEWTNSGIYDRNGNMVEFLSVGIDITERMKAEQAFEESRKKYQALIETTSDFIWEIDASGKYTYCSPQLEKLWGYKPEEMIGRTPFEVIHENDLQSFKDFFTRQVDSPSSFSGLETRAYDQRGNLIYLETGGVPFFGDDGKFLGYRGITRDISNRRKAEEQLERTNRRINEILMSIQDDFYVLDRNWNFVFASRQFTSSVGKEPDDFEGKNIWQMFPKYLGTIYEENCRAGMEKREIRRFEMSGKYTNAFYRITIFPSAEGITVIGTDITEQRKIEEVLQESEERFRAIFERSTIGKILVNIKMEIIQTNEAFAGMLGYTIPEMHKLNILQITYTDDRKHTKEAYRRVLSSEQVSYRYEKRYVHKNGSIIWADVSFTLMRDANDSPIYFIASITDISERKKAEEALQKALAEKEMLMRELQHRVKNSLSTAVSLIGLEQDGLRDKRLLTILSNTETRLRTMAMLYDELNQADDLERINMCAYLQTVVNALSKVYLSGEGPVKIETRITSMELEPKRAMPLGLIVNELLINSFKYAFPDGKAGNIIVELIQSGNIVELRVSDNGVGFAGPPNDPAGSSKLGLKLVELLTDQLEGKMTIEGEKGVTVKVVFEK